eukprot:scaffold4.g4706.t1
MLLLFLLALVIALEAVRRQRGLRRQLSAALLEASRWHRHAEQLAAQLAAAADARAADARGAAARELGDAGAELRALLGRVAAAAEAATSAIAREQPSSERDGAGRSWLCAVPDDQIQTLRQQWHESEAALHALARQLAGAERERAGVAAALHKAQRQLAALMAALDGELEGWQGQLDGAEAWEEGELQAASVDVAQEERQQSPGGAGAAPPRAGGGPLVLEQLHPGLLERRIPPGDAPVELLMGDTMGGCLSAFLASEEGTRVEEEEEEEVGSEGAEAWAEEAEAWAEHTPEPEQEAAQQLPKPACADASPAGRGQLGPATPVPTRW